MLASLHVLCRSNEILKVYKGFCRYIDIDILITTMKTGNAFIYIDHACNMSRVSCQKGPTRHAYAWQIRPFWQDTIDVSSALIKNDLHCHYSFFNMYCMFSIRIRNDEPLCSAKIVLHQQIKLRSPSSFSWSTNMCKHSIQYTSLRCTQNISSVLQVAD